MSAENDAATRTVRRVFRVTYEAENGRRRVEFFPTRESAAERVTALNERRREGDRDVRFVFAPDHFAVSTTFERLLEFFNREGNV